MHEKIQLPKYSECTQLYWQKKFSPKEEILVVTEKITNYLNEKFFYTCLKKSFIVSATR